jgi:hypothetical protein
MSESTNPIFDSEKEFLERQKEEYKNALMGNVEEIKDRSQRIGKKVLIAGGVLTGVYLLSKMLGSKSSDKDNPYYLSEKKAERHQYGRNDSGYRYEEERQSNQSENGTTSLTKSFVQSDLFKMISHQVSALLLVLITRKLEEYLGVNSFKKEEAAPEEETSVVIIEEATTVEPGSDPDMTFTDPDVR